MKKNISSVEKAREAIKILTGQIREEAEWQVHHFELHEKRIKMLSEKMKAEAKEDENMQQLQSIAGVGTVVSYAFVAHVGDGSRFNNGSQVSNFLGFVPRLDYSGSIHRHGHISKRLSSGLVGTSGMGGAL